MSRRLSSLVPPCVTLLSFGLTIVFFARELVKFVIPQTLATWAWQRVESFCIKNQLCRRVVIAFQCVAYTTRSAFAIRLGFSFIYSPSKSLSVNCCVKSSPPVRGSLGASSSPLEEFMFQGLQSKERERGN